LGNLLRVSAIVILPVGMEFTQAPWDWHGSVSWTEDLDQLWSVCVRRVINLNTALFPDSSNSFSHALFHFSVFLYIHLLTSPSPPSVCPLSLLLFCPFGNYCYFFSVKFERRLIWYVLIFSFLFSLIFSFTRSLCPFLPNSFHVILAFVSFHLVFSFYLYFVWQFWNFFCQLPVFLSALATSPHYWSEHPSHTTISS